MVGLEGSLAPQELAAVARDWKTTQAAVLDALRNNMETCRVSDLKTIATTINSWGTTYNMHGFGFPRALLSGNKQKVVDSLKATLNRLMLTRVSRAQLLASGRMEVPGGNAAVPPAYSRQSGDSLQQLGQVGSAFPRTLTFLNGLLNGSQGTLNGAPSRSVHHASRTPNLGSNRAPQQVGGVRDTHGVKNTSSVSARDFIMKSNSYRRANSPFTQMSAILAVTSRPHGMVRWTFNVDQGSMTKLRARTHKLHIRIYDTDAKRDLPWLPAFMPSVNGNGLFFQPPTKRLKKAKFATPPALSIGSVARVGENSLTMNLNDISANVFLSVQLSRIISIPELIARIPKIDKGSKEDDDVVVDDDVELEEEFQIVSLMCGLSLSPISSPGTGVNCRHAECFDIETYLGYCQQQHIWQCPCCNSALPFDDLRIDSRFMKFMNDAKLKSQGFEYVKLYPNGVYEGHDPLADKTGRIKSEAGSSDDESEAASRSKKRQKSNTGAVIAIPQSGSTVAAPSYASVAAGLAGGGRPLGAGNSPSMAAVVGKTMDYAICLDSD